MTFGHKKTPKIKMIQKPKLIESEPAEETKIFETLRFSDTFAPQPPFDQMVIQGAQIISPESAE